MVINYRSMKPLMSITLLFLLIRSSLGYGVPGTIDDCANVLAENRKCHKVIRQSKGDHTRIPKEGFEGSEVLSKRQFAQLVDALSGTEHGRMIETYTDRIDRRYPGHEVAFFEFNQIPFRNYLHTQEIKNRIQSGKPVVFAARTLSELMSSMSVDVLVGEIEIPLPKNQSMNLVYDHHVQLFRSGRVMGVLWTGKNREDTLVSLDIHFTDDKTQAFMSSDFTFEGNEYKTYRISYTGYTAVVQRDRYVEQEVKLVKEASFRRFVYCPELPSAHERAARHAAWKDRRSRYKEEKRNPSAALLKLNPRGVR